MYIKYIHTIQSFHVTKPVHVCVCVSVCECVVYVVNSFSAHFLSNFTCAVYNVQAKCIRVNVIMFVVYYFFFLSFRVVFHIYFLFFILNNVQPRGAHL